MPYRLEQSGSGYYVIGPSGRHSKKPMPRKRALAQMRALYAAETKASVTTGLAIPPTGYNALFNTPGVSAPGRRRKRKRTKANYDATVGQQIAGNLYRGAGGRFEAGSGGSLTAAQQRQQNRAGERNAYGRGEDAQRQAEDEAIAREPDRHKRAALRRQTALARRQRLYARREARRRMDEADAQARAQEREQRAQATAERRAARERAVAERRRQLEERRQARQKPAKPPKLSAAEKRKQKRESVISQMMANDTGLSRVGAEGLDALAQGGTINADAADQLMAMGLAERGANGRVRLTSQGRRANDAISRGDYGKALDAIDKAAEALAKKREREGDDTAATPTAQPTPPGTPPRPRPPGNTIGLPAAKARRYGGEQRSALPDSVFAGPDRSFPIRSARDVRAAVRSLGRTKHDRAAVRRGIIRRARAIGAVRALPESWRQKAVPSFTVFKDSQGHDRWVAISSTAYRDRDDEIVSRQALGGAVAAGDQSQQRGPLRYWHVPGVDIGDCDYQATAHEGRLLIESGTFRRPDYAVALKARGRDYQMSIGFVHPADQPNADGVFTDISIFERSIVPPGRASNPFTSITTKEKHMLQPEKDALLAELLGGRESEAYKAATATIATTDKAAQDQGVAYKDAPPWAQALLTRLDALEATVKAPMPPAAMIAAGTTEADDGMAEEDAAAADEAADDGEEESILTDAELDAIADRVADRLMARFDDITSRMASVDDELKTRGYSRMKEAAAEALQGVVTTVTAIDGRLKELEGGQPRSMHSQVWGDLTGQVEVTKAQAQALSAKGAPDANSIPEGLSEQERGAYALIFGQR